MKKLFLSIVVLMFLVTAAFAKINVNTASVEELQTITGIGPAKAEAIVKYRDEHGKFKSKDDLVQVKGIGDRLVDKISDEIEVAK